MTRKVRIVTTAGPSRTGSPEQLDREYQIHLNHARHYLRRALEAEANGEPGASSLFDKAQIEQNAANLCAQQSGNVMLAILISLLTEPEEREDEPLPAAGGAVQ
jgi:hypothetical protein